MKKSPVRGDLDQDLERANLRNEFDRELIKVNAMLGRCRTQPHGPLTSSFQDLLLALYPQPDPRVLERINSYWDFFMWLKEDKQHRLQVFNESEVRRLVEAIQPINFRAADRLRTWFSKKGDDIARLYPSGTTNSLVRLSTSGGSDLLSTLLINANIYGREENKIWMALKSYYACVRRHRLPLVILSELMSHTVDELIECPEASEAWWYLLTKGGTNRNLPPSLATLLQHSFTFPMPSIEDVVKALSDCISLNTNAWRKLMERFKSDVLSRMDEHIFWHDELRKKENRVQFGVDQPHIDRWSVEPLDLFTFLNHLDHPDRRLAFVELVAKERPEYAVVKLLPGSLERALKESTSSASEAGKEFDDSSPSAPVDPAVVNGPQPKARDGLPTASSPQATTVAERLRNSTNFKTLQTSVKERVLARLHGLPDEVVLKAIASRLRPGTKVPAFTPQSDRDQTIFDLDDVMVSMFRVDDLDARTLALAFAGRVFPERLGFLLPFGGY